MRKYSKKSIQINLVAVLIIAFCILELGNGAWKRIPIKSATAGNVNAVVKAVETDGNESIIYLEMANEDGSAFEEETEVGDIAIDSSGTLVSWQIENELSEDKKTLVYKIYLKHDMKCQDDVIEITLKDLVLAERGEKIADISIQQLLEEHRLTQTYAKEMETGQYTETAGIIPMTAIDDFILSGAGFSKDYESEETGRENGAECLYVRTRLTKPNEEKVSEATISKLYDEVTGGEIAYFYSSMTSDRQKMNEDKEKKQMTEINEKFYELTDTEKLEHIKPVIEYTIRQSLMKEEWHLRVRL